MEEDNTEEVSLPSPTVTRKGNPAWIGKSGNPKGRPPGKPNRSTLVQEAIRQQSEELIIKYLPDVIKVVIEQAKTGNMVAAKMLLDRAIPVKKSVEISNKDGQEFGVKIIIESVVQHEMQAEEIEEAQYTEVKSKEN